VFVDQRTVFASQMTRDVNAQYISILVHITSFTTLISSCGTRYDTLHVHMCSAPVLVPVWSSLVLCLFMLIYILCLPLIIVFCHMSYCRLSRLDILYLFLQP